MRSETENQTLLRIAASQAGWRLWRNNKGAGKLEDGSFVRWGLANDSAHLGSHIRSADLIGIRPLLILPEHLGTLIGQFASVEVKREGWRPGNTEHEVAQRRWRDLVLSLGGFATITSDPGIPK